MDHGDCAINEDLFNDLDVNELMHFQIMNVIVLAMDKDLL